MKVFIHINTSCFCAVFVNGRYIGRADADIFLHLCVENDGDLLISAAPADTRALSEKLLPCAVTVSARGSLVICKSRAALLTSFPQNHYELTISPERIYSFAPACALKREIFNYKGETHTATLIKDAAFQLVCEGAGLIYTHVLPQSFSLKELSVDAAGQAVVIKAYGAAGRDGEDCEYAAIITYDGAYSLNLNLLCDKIEFADNNRIQTLTSLRDIARRGVVTAYAFGAANRYEIESSYAVYLLNAALRPAHETLIPFAFFQAVKAGDFPEARFFLSDSLNAEISGDDALAAFFGDFNIIEENKYYPHLTDCAIVKSTGLEKNAAKLLFCKLDENIKITDLKIL